MNGGYRGTRREGDDLVSLGNEQRIGAGNYCTYSLLGSGPKGTLYFSGISRF